MGVAVAALSGGCVVCVFGGSGEGVGRRPCVSCTVFAECVAELQGKIKSHHATATKIVLFVIV